MSSSTMTRSPVEHVTVELLSAYIDEQLPGDEVRQLEAHLSDCNACQRRLEGLRQTASDLRQLKTLTPPKELELLVARRIALEGKKSDLSDRIDSLFSGFSRQSSFLVMFAIVIALAVIILIFSQAVEHSQQHEATMIPIIVHEDAEAESVVVAGRKLGRTPGGWIEDGVDVNAVDQTLNRDSVEAIAFFEQHPELRALIELPGPVIFNIDGETVKLID